MKTLLKEPLALFACLGIALFSLFALVGDESDEELGNAVTVDEAALLTFIQYQTRSFDEDLARRRLAAMDEVTRQRLIDDLVREEVLYREGLALGLDDDDYVIRRRLIQKVEFLAQGVAAAAGDISEEDLAGYFEDNRDSYFVPPSVTFTHVFVNRENHGDETVQHAEALLADLNDNQVPFSDAPRYGDRFPFHVNYVERTPDFVASHFGADMASSIMAAEPGETWIGPFQSEYGAHLVRISAAKPGRTPELAEVRVRVLQDAARQLLQDQQESAVNDIIAKYDVTIEGLPEAAQ